MAIEKTKQEILELVQNQKKARVKWVASVLGITEDQIRKSAKELGLIVEDDSIMIPSEAKDAEKKIDPKERLINEIIAVRNSKKREVLKEKQDKFARIIAYTFSGDFISLDGRGGLNFIENMRTRLQNESIETLRNYISLSIYYDIYGYPDEKVTKEKLAEIKQQTLKIDEKIKAYAYKLANLAITETKGKKLLVYLPSERMKYYISDHLEHINYSLQVTFRSEIREGYFRALDQGRIKNVTSESGYYTHIDFPALLYEIAMNWLQRGYNRKVSVYLNLVLEENPDLHQAYIDLSQIYIRLKEYDKAKELLEKIKDKDEKSPKLWSNIAMLNLLEGDSKEFIEAIGKAEELDKEFADLYIVKSKEYLQSENITDALNQIKKALELDKNSIYASEEQIDIFYKKKDFDSAISELLRIINEYKNPFLMIKLGKLYEEQKLDSKAYDIYNEALKYIPRNPILMKRLGSIYLKMEKYQEAVDAFKRVLDDRPDDSEILYKLGFAYEKLKNNNLAIDVLENSLKIDSSNIVGWKLLGEIYQKVGNQKKAKDCQNKAQKLMKKS